MGNELLRFQVELFLSSFKECDRKNLIYFGDMNRKTTKFLREIGWTYQGMSAYVIQNIQPEDYFRGLSEHHRLPNRTVAEFGMAFEEQELYVKLELIVERNQFVAGYLSFHPREKIIEDYPLKKECE